MRGSLKITAALAAALAQAFTSPAIAQDETDHTAPVIAAADAFFAALRDPDKAALAKMVIPASVITVHNRMDPETRDIVIISMMEHLENWAKSPPGTDERMRYASVLVDGDMAHVWGPYVFMIDGAPTHCGINSLSMVNTPQGWRLGNTSFTMEPVDQCKALGAPEVPSK